MGSYALELIEKGKRIDERRSATNWRCASAQRREEDRLKAELQTRRRNGKMKTNQLAVRMAAKDLDGAQRYLALASAMADHAALILADEARRDPELRHASKQAKAVLKEIKRTVDAADCLALADLRGYTAPVDPNHGTHRTHGRPAAVVA